MSDLPLEKAITLDDLMQLSSRVEIINGEIIEMTAAGGTHQIIGGNIFRALDSTGVGAVFYDGLTYLMFSPASNLKYSFVPDVSFIRLENIPANWDINRPHPGVPDLAIEIVSPGDDANTVLNKIRTYLDKGTEQVWVVYPVLKEVHQYLRDEAGTVRIYKGTQAIDTSAFFPNLALTADMIFQMPPWAMRDE